MTLHSADPLQVISEQSPRAPRAALLGTGRSLRPEIWARKPWLSRAEDLPGSVTDVFSPASRRRTVEPAGIAHPFIRLAKDGRVLPGSRFTGSGGAGASIADQVQDDAVMRLFADGATVVLQALHRTWPAVGELAAGLSEDLGHAVQVNAYITPPQSQGFAAHYDTHDVFVLQIAGRKRWRIHEPVFTDPLPENPWGIRSRAGTCTGRRSARTGRHVRARRLSLPATGIHPLRTGTGGTSLHPHLRRPLRDRTRHREGGDEASRVIRVEGFSPASWNPGSPEGHAQIQQVVDELRGPDTSTCKHSPTLCTISGTPLQRPEPIAPLAHATLAANLTPADRLRLRHHVNPRTQEQPDKSITLVAAGQRLHVDARQLDALERMLGRRIRVRGPASARRRSAGPCPSTTSWLASLRHEPARLHVFTRSPRA